MDIYSKDITQGAGRWSKGVVFAGVGSEGLGIVLAATKHVDSSVTYLLILVGLMFVTASAGGTLASMVWSLLSPSSERRSIANDLYWVYFVALVSGPLTLGQFKAEGDVDPVHSGLPEIASGPLVGHRIVEVNADTALILKLGSKPAEATISVVKLDAATPIKTSKR